MIEMIKEGVKKKFYPIDLEGAIKDKWAPVDKDLNVKSIIAQVNTNIKKYKK